MHELKPELASSWIVSLAKELSRLRGQRKAQINRLADIFSEDPIRLSQLFVEPKFQELNPANHNEEGVPPVRELAFPYIREFVRKDVTQYDGQHVLFVLADAGMGKTSLLLILALTHITSFWPRDQGMSLLKLGRDSLSEITRIPAKRQHLLLLDSLDEDCMATGRPSRRVRDILDATRGFRKVVITCRTQFLPAGLIQKGMLNVGSYQCPVKYLALFEDSDIEKYLSKKFPERRIALLFKQRNNKLDSAEAVTRRMGTLRMRPLLLSYVEVLVEGDLHGEVGVADLYHAIIGAWTRKEALKLEHMNEPVSPEDLLSFCRSLALELGQVNQHHISSGRLEEIADAHNLGRFMRSYTVSGRSLINRRSDGSWRFSHYSIQEFLIYDMVRATGNRDGLRMARNSFTQTLLSECWAKFLKRLNGVLSEMLAPVSRMDSEQRQQFFRHAIVDFEGLQRRLLDQHAVFTAPVFSGLRKAGSAVMVRTAELGEVLAVRDMIGWIILGRPSHVEAGWAKTLFAKLRPFEETRDVETLRALLGEKSLEAGFLSFLSGCPELHVSGLSDLVRAVRESALNGDFSGMEKDCIQLGESAFSAIERFSHSLTLETKAPFDR